MKAPGWLRRAALRHLSGDLFRRASSELLAIRPGEPMVPTVAGPIGVPDGAGGYRMVADGVAEVPICGYLSRDMDLMRAIGLSAQRTTSEMVAALQAADADPAVRGVMAYVDSGGGSTRGLSELIATMRAMSKPVHAFAEAACSGAYWVAAQAERITVSQLGEVGHIGAIYRLVDASEAAAAVGVKVHLIRTGPVKGAGLDEMAGLSEAELAYFQRRVDETLEFFLAGVAGGRGMTAEQVKALADGGGYSSTAAVANGLADAAGTYADAVAALAEQVAATPSEVITEPESTELEAPPIEEVPVEEKAMSKPNAETPGDPGLADNERSILRRLAEVFSGKVEEKVEAAPAAAVTAEQVAKMVEAGVNARMAAQEVTADLRQFEGKATPGAIAKARPAMVKAKTAGDEETYAALLGVLAEQDASYLLDGEIASAEETSEGTAHAVSGRAEVMARNGIDKKREDELTRKYGYRLTDSIQ